MTGYMTGLPNAGSRNSRTGSNADVACADSTDPFLVILIPPMLLGRPFAPVSNITRRLIIDWWRGPT